jgi:hypothetical protein
VYEDRATDGKIGKNFFQDNAFLTITDIMLRQPAWVKVAAILVAFLSLLKV